MSDLRLNPFTLATFAPGDAASFAYDRGAQATGIVHFGIGAFHRAHQAWYTDRAMSAGDRNWAITGVSLRSGEVAHQMNPQEGLYTVTERAGEGASTRIIGAVRDVLVAPYEPEAVAAADPDPGVIPDSFQATLLPEEPSSMVMYSGLPSALNAMLPESKMVTLEALIPTSSR